MGDSGGTGTIIIYLLIIIAEIAGGWKIFEKAGKPGWAVLIPIYNIIVGLQIIGKPAWWIILLLIPIVNIVIAIICCLALLEKFSKPGWHILGMIFIPFIYLPYLGFSDAKFQGGAAPA